MHHPKRRSFLIALGAAPWKLAAVPAENWYQKSFYLLHEDHHTGGDDEVGRDADPAETARLINLSRPDVIQIHAKGNPGWTTYPTRIGHTPPKLARDVMEVWRGVARKHCYKFSAYYNLGRDGEIMKRRPEWNRVRANGQLYERALCYHSGVAENYLWPMIDEINTRYQPDGFWFDGSCFTVSVCYCPKCRGRFRRERAMDAPESPQAPGWAEYKEMQRQIYREFVRETVARIKKAAPACLVAVNWAYSLIMPEPVDGSLDYLTGDRSNEVDVLSSDAHWYDAQSRPFDLMTNVRLSTPDQPKPAEQIQQEVAIIIANGGRFFVWDNPTRSSGLVAARHEFLAKSVAPFLRERQQWCLGTPRIPDVSLLNCSADHYAATFDSPVVFARAKARVVERTDVLCRAHLNYEMVHDRQLLSGEIHSGVLILDDTLALPPGAAAALRGFLDKGGTLLATGRATLLPDVKGLKGRVIAANEPLSAALLDRALPPAKRILRTDAPETVEVVLRSQGAGQVVHLINRAAGKREVLSDNPLASRVRISAIPPVAECRVWVRAAKKPSAVKLQPSGETPKWTFSKGVLEIAVPSFPIHQIITTM